ncbi:NAD-dependent epimerase/dehydratase family protein [Coxiella burnetii]|uniref:NAD dependent epimerase/dehydratase family n=1 Tax=Coxiella burnetii (strain RSA 493 / Nine Mile phase I) TaxID=227377 RepID=Q83DA9_COXBU|nr:NAD-dependent epimerase/dehydratase family protein [Coxiella burnetii]NP_819849.2 NAD dependent epimerase/dehydratase family protein [Coxiella burnetii RSA 493]AAO90363.2 NAD dependent epimerase/dehydratase family [Coxiella burnetii RSA 493]ARI65662.1 NAD-dependent dehydratase [Coxiella burnetii]MCF2092952.1 NAD-dependent epimerase/dehydratase family protein [Coxiella burnetii]MCF2094854.1 NAD-dependent epimerase/dehydratase family protein [Coxiella burnetii]MCF2097020.1 NAD-dependent epim
MMDIRGKKFVVIGGAGLIGSHTVDRLLQEDVAEVIIYDNFVRGTRENLAQALRDPRTKIYDIGGDINQTDILNTALKGVDGVFHFAALWLLQCYEYPRSAFQTNIQGTFNVLETCVAQGVKRLVFSSSASVYGDALEEPMTEAHPFNSRTFYGATKIAGEAMATAYHHRYGLPFVGLRYMNVYGPRQDYRGAYIAVIMKMLDALDKGQPMTLYGDGSQAYDFVYVEDCAAANICAMKADTVDEYYNVGTGKRTSILELAKEIQKITGTSDNIQFLPQGTTFVKNRIGCPKKAAEQIGFKAEVGLTEGLQRLIEWRRSHIAEVEQRREVAIS